MDRRTWLKVSLGAGAAAGWTALGEAAGQEPSIKPRLRSSRAAHLGRLKEYARAGKFPTNLIDEVLTTPVFYDHRGNVPCAVAHLMIEDGRRDDVMKIAAATNTVKISALSDGPVLDWILQSGFTQEECALIQPSYRWEGATHAPTAAALIQMHLYRVHDFLASGFQTQHGLELAALRLKK